VQHDGSAACRSVCVSVERSFWPVLRVGAEGWTRSLASLSRATGQSTHNGHPSPLHRVWRAQEEMRAGSGSGQDGRADARGSAVAVDAAMALALPGTCWWFCRRSVDVFVYCPGTVTGIRGGSPVRSTSTGTCTCNSALRSSIAEYLYKIHTGQQTTQHNTEHSLPLTNLHHHTPLCPLSSEPKLQRISSRTGAAGPGAVPV
jgi:hypothetical protein